jgi:hypothetical protein
MVVDLPAGGLPVGIGVVKLLGNLSRTGWIGRLSPVIMEKPLEWDSGLG